VLAEPTFDQERLEVDRLFIANMPFSFPIAKPLGRTNRQALDRCLRPVRTIPLNFAKGNDKRSLKDRNRLFEIARRSPLECAAVHDVLQVCHAMDKDANCRDKTDRKRIVSMLTPADSKNQRSLRGSNPERVRVPRCGGRVRAQR
jgi:hypothetical protein